jgi:hypothetical protein
MSSNKFGRRNGLRAGASVYVRIARAFVKEAGIKKGLYDFI